MNKLQIVFDRQFKLTYNDLEKTAITTFSSPSKKKLSVKLQIFNSETYETLQSFYNKRTSPNSLMPDQYTEQLFREYDYRMPEYEEPIIDYFIEEYLETLKEQFKDKTHAIAENIEFSAKETVELIAKWKATKLFLNRLDNLKEITDIEVLHNKIRIDYVEPVAKPLVMMESEEEKLTNEKELTTRQQVLLFHYIFNFLGVINIDNSVKARLIKQLTGKNHKNIYDIICNPFEYNSLKEFKKNMKVLKEEFEKLGLVEMANKVLKDSDNN